jgi:endonuclease/exonuclease/phosphatase family metal-dependent hydrolase
MQYMKIYHDGKPLTIFNIHGLWNGQGKDDTPERIIQSQKAIDFITSTSYDVIVIGDFNINPDTKSLLMFENAGLRNLIAEYGITSTHTSLYLKKIGLPIMHLFLQMLL